MRIGIPHRRPNALIRIATMLGVLFVVAVGAQAQSAAEGQALFGTKCYSCHNIGSGDKQGPDLKGVTTRRQKAWLHEFINTPAAINAKGDPTATQLFKKFAPTVMADQALTPQQIDSILMMIKISLIKTRCLFPPARS